MRLDYRAERVAMRALQVKFGVEQLGVDTGVFAPAHTRSPRRSRRVASRAR